ncbi:hypothetical protein F5B20DRAFT_550034 [Whalleya microplaca]|nr:hypothetical protein F5B20DRAFT_550034 [Whalleya microplaca]
MSVSRLRTHARRPWPQLQAVLPNVTFLPSSLLGNEWCYRSAETGNNRWHEWLCAQHEHTSAFGIGQWYIKWGHGQKLSYQIRISTLTSSTPLLLSSDLDRSSVTLPLRTWTTVRADFASNQCTGTACQPGSVRRIFTTLCNVSLIFTPQYVCVCPGFNLSTCH